MCKRRVIPCSGIGKVHGAIAREAAMEVVKKSDKVYEIVCLAHIVTGDKEAKDKIQDAQCVTIDGCPAMCAYKNVTLGGGQVVESVRVIDEMKKHRGKKPGSATNLTEDGWLMVDNIADYVCGKIEVMSGDDE